MYFLRLSLSLLALAVAPALSAQTLDRTGQWVVAEGDIIVGRATDPAGAKGSMQPRYALSIPPSAGTLWPRVGSLSEVPYTNPNGFAAVEEAVRVFNQTFDGVIQFVRRGEQADFIEFQMEQKPDAGGCAASANLGRVGGMQPIPGTYRAGAEGICVSVLLHEIGHALGLHHEQSRSDREGHARINWGNISDRSQYDKPALSADIGFYDAGSIMHYASDTFAVDRNEVTMETVPVGIPVGVTETYSAGDIDVVRRLYGAAPVQITVATNPAGLLVAADDLVVPSSAGQAAFSWVLGSTHTLDVPANIQLQTLNGRGYAFARWSDVAYNPEQPGADARHDVTIAAGDASSLVYPAENARNTVYLANFREVLPASAIRTAADPAAGGAVAIETVPTTLQGNSYFFADQPLSVRAAPAAGFNFYGWDLGSKANSVGVNPRTIRAGRTDLLTARFTTSPVVTVMTNPAGLKFKMDDKEFTGSRGFGLPFDGAWTPASAHALDVTSPQASIVDDPGAQHVFTGWSDGGDKAHTVKADGNATITANFVTRFPLSVSQAGSANSCSVALRTDPVSEDSYYQSGATVTLAAEPAAGWTWIGWDGGVKSTDISVAVTMTSTRNVRAVLNTVAEPLAISKIAPEQVALNGAAQVLAFNGTGFTNGTFYCVFDEAGGDSRVCGLVGYKGTNEVTMPLSSDLLTKAQRLQVMLFNAVGDCRVSVMALLPVR